MAKFTANPPITSFSTDGRQFDADENGVFDLAPGDSALFDAAKQIGVTFEAVPEKPAKASKGEKD